MKKRYPAIMFIALLLAMFSFVEHAGAELLFPHNFGNPAEGDPGNGYGCAVCHNSHTTLGSKNLNNICLSCHNPSDPLGKTKPFTQADAANISSTQSVYSSGVTPSRLYQTSHSWTGPALNPVAGTKNPTSPALQASRNFAGKLICVTCHNVHDTRPTALANHFLRVDNSIDQLCLDCHSSRDNITHTLGSHPVNFTYTSASSKAKTAPASYFSAPINANPSNPTSQLVLNNGRLLCTTCHSVHYADSRSSTVDGAANFRNLSASNGSILRTDLHGKTAANINICTNCHKMPDHNTGGGQLQCGDCHSGHVDRISPEDVAAGEGKPNTFLFRRYMNFSGSTKLSTYRKKAFYQTTSLASAKWTTPNGTGYCQSCHRTLSAIPADHAVLLASSSTTKSDCTKIGCHVDSPHSGKPVVSLVCGNCHGMPPTRSFGGGNGSNDGYAFDRDRVPKLNYYSSGVYKNESTSGHATHSHDALKPGGLYKYVCSQCHNGNTSTGHHDNNTSTTPGQFQWVFKDNNAQISNTAGANPLPNPQYVGTGSGTCSNIYCHSNGVQRAGVTTKYKSVTWANSRNTIVGMPGNAECVQCHNGVNATYNNMSTSSHFRHVSNVAATGAGYTCNYCHNATVSNNTTISSIASHVDGVVNVATWAGLGSTNFNWNQGTATCTTYCHSDGGNSFGKPIVYAPAIWTDKNSGKCGTCHSVQTTGSIINTNAHFAHLSSSWGPRFIKNAAPVSCNKCHTYTTEIAHVNGVINMGASSSSCDVCHPSNTVNSVVYGTPVFNTTGLACESCHSGTTQSSIDYIAPFKPYTTISKHGHFQAGAYSGITCKSCHNPKSNHITAVLGSTDRLINGYQSSNTGIGDNQICSVCHSTGQLAAAKIRLTHVRNQAEGTTTPTMVCSVCHDVHGVAKNDHMVTGMLSYSTNVLTQISYLSKTSAPYMFVANSGPYRGICQACHTKTNHFRRGKDENTALNGGLGWNSAGTDHRGFQGGSQDCLACHKHNSGMFAFSASGGSCSGCHGYPPVPKSTVISATNYPSAKFEDYSGAGGSHTAFGHVPTMADPSKGFALCNSCHNALDHNMSGSLVPTQIKVSINSRLRFNSAILPKYTSNRLDGAAHITGTCSNVSCHFQTTPKKWGNK